VKRAECHLLVILLFSFLTDSINYSFIELEKYDFVEIKQNSKIPKNQLNLKNREKNDSQQINDNINLSGLFLL